MSQRQFSTGYISRESTGGMPFRIRRGTKGDDLVLEWWTPDKEWQPVHMKALGMAVAFMIENEDHLYPEPHHLGGDWFRFFLKQCEQDWVAASYELAKQSALAERRRRLGPAA